MQGVNKVIIVGNLGKAPELRKSTAGISVSNFTVATNEKWKDKSGEKQEKTEWHRIVVWGPMADACEKYLDRGSSVYIEGRLQTREWTDKEDVKRYSTEIVASSVVFLERKSKDEDESPTTDDFGPPPEN